jgi:hypothetical protein
MVSATDEASRVGATAAWCGWFRPRVGVTWSKIAEGQTYDEALARLLDALAALRGNGESIVLEAGRHPNDRRAGRRWQRRGRETGQRAGGVAEVPQPSAPANRAENHP